MGWGGGAVHEKPNQCIGVNCPKREGLDKVQIYTPLGLIPIDVYILCVTTFHPLPS